jgi:hypothetical protein
MHFRLPSFDRGVTSFLWALLLSVYVWAGLLAIGVSAPTAFVIATLCLFAIFLFVRLQGGDQPRRPS